MQHGLFSGNFACTLQFDICIEKLMINNQYVGSGAIHWRGALDCFRLFSSDYDQPEMIMTSKQNVQVVEPSTGEELGPQETGELCFKGPQV